jgi:hypothetical protein
MQQASGNKDRQANFNITIQAVDAQSFAELTSRNPDAVVGPWKEAWMKGDQSLHSMIGDRF